jgi:ParB-like chromosome segregation protein Spo0J
MNLALEIINLNDIHPNPDLMSREDFQIGLKERADEREESILRGISIEPLLINKDGFELMDGYTRYTVLKRYEQKEVYAYVGTIGVNDSHG